MASSIEQESVTETRSFESSSLAGSSSSSAGGQRDGKRAQHPKLKLRGKNKKKRMPGDPDPRDGTPRPLMRDIVRENECFERYYSGNGVVPEGEKEVFMATLKDSLPTSFRVTLTNKFSRLLETRLAGFSAELDGQVVDEKTTLGPRPVAWGRDMWQYEVPPPILKKHRDEPVRGFHRWLINQSTVGSVSRQELVSMIPPLFLDVRSHHLVLDMCAAPGSKSKQIVEMMMKDAGDAAMATGCLVANDSDRNRCTTLVGHLKTLDSPNWIVTQHPAQMFPLFRAQASSSNASNAVDTSDYLQFDRILCDVPCSGDGTLRKNPDLWAKWNPRMGTGQHLTQLSIAMRGASLLREGGRMVYSTCSLNPVEDEAVVCEILRRTRGALQLVDCSAQLPDFKRRPGLSTWSLLDQSLDQFFSDYASYGSQDRALNPGKPIFETAFPPTAEEAAGFHLERCLRVLPQDQNTGGFFVAVFQKVAPFSEFSFKTRQIEASLASKDQEKDQDQEDLSADGKELNDDVPVPIASSTSPLPAASGTRHVLDWTPKKRGIEEPFILLRQLSCAPRIERLLTDFYKLAPEFPWDRLVVRNTSDSPRNISLISDGMNRIFKADGRNLLQIINAGLLVFQHRKNPGTPDAIPYQMHSCGIHIAAYWQSLRTVELPFEEFKAIALNPVPEYPAHNLSEETKALLAPLSVGPITLRIRLPESVCDWSNPVLTLAGWKGRQNLRLMIEQHQRQFFQYAFNP